MTNSVQTISNNSVQITSNNSIPTQSNNSIHAKSSQSVHTTAQHCRQNTHDCQTSQTKANNTQSCQTSNTAAVNVPLMHTETQQPVSVQSRTSNLWQETGLCNGATGIVQEIIYKYNQHPPSLPISVLVEFDKYSGPPFIENHPTWVPIPPVTFEWSDTRRHSRRQLPLRLSYAMTIHKSQGQTLNKAVIDIGAKERTAGLTFIALSRLRQLNHAIIQPMTYERLNSISKSKQTISRIKEEDHLKKLFEKTVHYHKNN
jgi:ATP-dependent DNA helicase PIF1